MGYSFQPLKLEHYHLIAEMQKQTLNGLEDTSIFQLSTTDFIQGCLTDRGVTIGAFIDEDLVGYFMLFFPHSSSKNLGIDLHLPESELPFVVHLDTVAVIPAYRTTTLSLRLFDQVFLALESLPYHHICATVSPHNPPSARLCIKKGLVVRAIKLKFTNKLRYILYKDKRKKERSKYTDTSDISLDKIDQQKQFLAAGYEGYAITKNTEGFKLRLGKPMP